MKTICINILVLFYFVTVYIFGDKNNTLGDATTDDSAFEWKIDYDRAEQCFQDVDVPDSEPRPSNWCRFNLRFPLFALCMEKNIQLRLVDEGHMTPTEQEEVMDCILKTHSPEEEKDMADAAATTEEIYTDSNKSPSTPSTTKDDNRINKNSATTAFEPKLRGANKADTTVRA